jgi:glycosyltransferase involved in cell wall biosynthesis
VLSMANAWDYMDYAYLHRICRDDGVRFVSVVYDVIAMQFPFTTPSAQHIYHRHWVEIGHSAAHLLAISRFSVDQYVEYIAEPNELSPALSHAYLPNFLRDRADEIGEMPVVGLLRRNFVVFCSTIETRKNHLLLLQLWDRLRLEFDQDVLPLLVFVGKWGWGTETVRIMSERNYHLRGRLMILDRVSDAELIWIYRHARFTLFPSLSEGYGLGAAESLSFGTPVVVSNCPALIEATEGLMPAHDPLDFMAWLDEMRGLIRDDARLDELRQAAARYRGPAYDAFAGAVRDIAVSVSHQTVPAIGRV